ncbi:hypothetical protein UP09_27955 [Bradyrhizobium sp. LTSP885]|uniref:winged helix-turn-helix domain-containing protein n=1 Tax=Bradyrhizobium sp. LTSP885 TaxID=1619232 RepID=UPI0005C858F9|nr:transcriptional regulator [Bradyrhizobium sp. LTSP885]KJC37094.1 hypothetical protein UP09_27955 [Bradyrhizobium sp. LTSP885]
MLDKSIDVAFVFGPFRLIPSQHVLERDSRPVKLGGRALDILHLLVMRAGEEVSKNTLIEWAWPNIVVDERNLKVHIRSLRKALDDTFPQATYIATVVGHGYKFVGAVQTQRIQIADFSRDQQPVVSNLPAPATLVGRQRDVEGAARALDFTRLVTLVGPGGVGKTSLAIAVAHARWTAFRSRSKSQPRSSINSLPRRSSIPSAGGSANSGTDAPRRKATLASSRAWCMTFARQFHDETDDAWSTALDFAERSGDVGQRLLVMCGRSYFLIGAGRHEQAASLLDDVCRIAAQSGDRASLLDGERLLAQAEMHLGKLLDVRAKLERLVKELAHGMPPSSITRYQEQRYVSIYTTLAFSAWLTGRPEHALAMAEEIVLKTGQIGQLLGQSHILAGAAMPLALWSGKIDSLERYSAILRCNLDRENIPLWEPVHRFYASVVRHARGDLNAVDDMRSAVEELVRDRFLVRTPMYLGVLAEALLERGRSADADEAVEFAFTLQRQSKENWCLPELLRVKAQTIAALGMRDHARVMLGRARENARAIGARTLELRIMNDMAQMAIAEGNNEEAVGFLVPVYESFGDGTATEDLKRSACLLTAAGANRTPMPLAG